MFRWRSRVRSPTRVRIPNIFGRRDHPVDLSMASVRSVNAFERTPARFIGTTLHPGLLGRPPAWPMVRTEFAVPTSRQRHRSVIDEGAPTSLAPDGERTQTRVGAARKAVVGEGTLVPRATARPAGP